MFSHVRLFAAHGQQHIYREPSVKAASATRSVEKQHDLTRFHTYAKRTCQTLTRFHTYAKWTCQTLTQFHTYAKRTCQTLNVLTDEFIQAHSCSFLTLSCSKQAQEGLDKRQMARERESGSYTSLLHNAQHRNLPEPALGTPPGPSLQNKPRLKTGKKRKQLSLWYLMTNVQSY